MALRAGLQAPDLRAQDPLKKREIPSPKRIAVLVGQGSFMNQLVQRTRQHLLKYETAWNSQRRAQSMHRKETVKTSQSRQVPGPWFARHFDTHQFRWVSLRTEVV